MFSRIFIGSLLTLAASQAYAQSLYNPDQLAQFNEVNFCSECNLSGATLSGNHSQAALTSSNLTGVRGTGTFSAANFAGSNLSTSDWTGANLSYAQMSFIVLIKTNFSNANLSFANFEGSNTVDAVFDGAILYGSNITQQQLTNAASYCWAILPDGSKHNC